MKACSTYLTVGYIGFLFILILSCSKVPTRVEPTVTASSAIDITSTSATAIGNVTSDGGAEVSTKGFCWSASNTLPTTSDSKASGGNGAGNFSISLSGLSPGTTYNLRAFATNSVGTAYSSSSTFKTLGIVPIITTTDILSITATTLKCGGNILNDGGSPITARGICWSTNPNPTLSDNKTLNGSGIGEYMSDVVDLLPGVTYYLRAYATNSVGTSYGNQVLVKTNFGTMTDIDGNIYQTVKIGSQVWSKENLKVSKLNDGTPIPFVTDNIQWSNLSAPGYCWYNNDGATNKSLYGGLYNWKAVKAGKLCPTGWHVPTDEEWTILTEYLTNNNYGFQGSGNDVSKSMAAATEWAAFSGAGTIGNDPGSNNSSGFSALPGGVRHINGTFEGVNGVTYLWCQSEPDLNGNVIRWVLTYNLPGVDRTFGSIYNGFSVRCLSGEMQQLTVNTAAASNITSTSVVSGGNITNDGGKTVTSRGVCWSTNPSPTVSDFRTVNGSGAGSFSSTLVGLTANTKYYVRSYATNSAVTAYGNEISFTTMGSVLTLSTTAVTSITTNSAISGGNISNDGGGTITARGVCWSTHSIPTILDSKTTDAAGIGSYTSTLTGLASNTRYYIRSYATNAFGTTYGNELSFNTLAEVLYNNTAWIIDQNNEYQLVALHTNNSMIGIKINPEKNTEYTAIFRKTSVDSPGILVKINSEGLPYQIYVNGNIMMLGNFTPTTVDIVIIRPNKTNEILRNVNLSQLASLRKFKKSLFVGGEVKASDVISTVGIALSVGVCAVEVAGAVSTGGALAPLAAIGCGMALVDILAAFDTTNDNELQKIYNTNAYVGTAFNFLGCVKLKPADCIGLYNAGLGLVSTAAEKSFQDEKNQITTAFAAFSVNSSIPIIDTFPVTNILSTSAISGVSVVSNGGHAIVAKGVCWNTSPSPTIFNSKSSDGAGDAATPGIISGLTPGTKYYVRAYATNSVGTAYGEEKSFIAGAWQLIQDDISISGNTKCWVYNGTQRVDYEAQGTPVIWGIKGDIVFSDSGTNLEVYYFKQDDDITTDRQDPVAVKIEINGNQVKLSLTGNFTYEVIGQMNSSKTEINGVGTFSEVIPPTSNCEGFTVSGSANCKIIISH